MRKRLLRRVNLTARQHVCMFGKGTTTDTCTWRLCRASPYTLLTLGLNFLQFHTAVIDALIVIQVFHGLKIRGSFFFSFIKGDRALNLVAVSSSSART